MNTLANRITIVAATDDGFALPTATLAASLMASAEPGRAVDFYVLDGGMSRPVATRLRRALARTEVQARRGGGGEFRSILLDVDLGAVAGLKTLNHITIPTYLRLFIPQLLPAHVDRVIYLDGDILALRDIGPLFDVDLGGAPAAGAPNISAPTVGRRMRHHARLGLNPDAPYVNSGVLVLDLDRWRKDQIGAAVLDDLRAHQHLYRFHDQCGLNAVLHNDWAILPPEWNVQCGSGKMRAAPAPLSDIALLHFTSQRKPWKPDYAAPPGHTRQVAVYRRLWLAAARDSGWFTAREWLRFRGELAAKEAYFRLRWTSDVIKKVVRGKIRGLRARVGTPAKPL